MLSIEYSKKKALSTKSEGNRRKSLKTTIFRFQKEEFLPIVHRLVVFKPFLTSAMPFLWQSRWGSSGLQSIVSTTFLYTFLSNPTVTFSIAASSQAKGDTLSKITDHICDFSRCRLNVRLCARIQPLLRGHKYGLFILLRVSPFACGKLLFNVQNLFHFFAHIFRFAYSIMKNCCTSDIFDCLWYFDTRQFL